MISTSPTRAFQNGDNRTLHSPEVRVGVSQPMAPKIRVGVSPYTLHENTQVRVGGSTPIQIRIGGFPPSLLTPLSINTNGCNPQSKEPPKAIELTSNPPTATQKVADTAQQVLTKRKKSRRPTNLGEKKVVNDSTQNTPVKKTRTKRSCDLSSLEEIVILEPEQDLHRLAQRAKQVFFGFGTKAFLHSFVKGEFLKWPNPKINTSKRSWDGMIASWRRNLHYVDDSAPSPQMLENPRVKRILNIHKMILSEIRSCLKKKDNESSLQTDSKEKISPEDLSLNDAENKEKISAEDLRLQHETDQKIYAFYLKVDREFAAFQKDGYDDLDNGVESYLETTEPLEPFDSLGRENSDDFYDTIQATLEAPNPLEEFDSLEKESSDDFYDAIQATLDALKPLEEFDSLEKENSDDSQIHIAITATLEAFKENPQQIPNLLI